MTKVLTHANNGRNVQENSLAVASRRVPILKYSVEDIVLLLLGSYECIGSNAMGEDVKAAQLIYAGKDRAELCCAIVICLQISRFCQPIIRTYSLHLVAAFT